MDIVLVPFLRVCATILHLYSWAVLAMVILSWLTSFNIVNGYNRFVFLTSAFLFRITEPLLQHIRRVVPSLGGIDLSPMALILAIWFFQEVLSRLIAKF